MIEGINNKTIDSKKVYSKLQELNIFVSSVIIPKSIQYTKKDQKYNRSIINFGNLIFKYKKKSGN